MGGRDFKQNPKPRKPRKVASKKSPEQKFGTPVMSGPPKKFPKKSEKSRDSKKAHKLLTHKLFLPPFVPGMVPGTQSGFSHRGQTGLPLWSKFLQEKTWVCPWDCTHFVPGTRPGNCPGDIPEKLIPRATGPKSLCLCAFSLPESQAVPQGVACQGGKNTTVILIHYGVAGKKNTTAVKHYGRDSANTLFSWSKIHRRSPQIVNQYGGSESNDVVVFLVRPGPSWVVDDFGPEKGYLVTPPQKIPRFTLQTPSWPLPLLEIPPPRRDRFQVNF